MKQSRRNFIKISAAGAGGAAFLGANLNWVKAAISPENGEEILSADGKNLSDILHIAKFVFGNVLHGYI